MLDALPLPPEPFAAELLVGVGEHADEIDATIRAYAKGWTLERMPALDRALLRIGVYELTCTPEVPTGAVISEAVELAKTFSTDDSGKFVNGMLAPSPPTSARPDQPSRPTAQSASSVRRGPAGVPIRSDGSDRPTAACWSTQLCVHRGTGGSSVTDARSTAAMATTPAARSQLPGRGRLRPRVEDRLVAR